MSPHLAGCALSSREISAGKQVQCRRLPCQILWYFSECAAASSVSLPAISGTKAGLRERCRGGSDMEEVKRLKGERAAAHMLIPFSSPPTNTHTHTHCFSVPFFLSFISLDSPWMSEQGYQSDSSLAVAPPVRLPHLSAPPRLPRAALSQRRRRDYLAPSSDRIKKKKEKKLRNICEDWWAVKESHPLTLCWHVGSLQPPVNLRLHIHQLAGRLSKVSLSFWASSTDERRRDFGNMCPGIFFLLNLKRKSISARKRKSFIFNCLLLHFIYICPLINEAHFIG